MKANKDLKYPIKYAIMPIEEQVGCYTGLNQLEPEYGVVANIVSKCYVISERKLFLSDGNYKSLYEVVFPYVKERSKSKLDFESVIPEFNIDSQCINSISVDQVFDSFEDASVVADKLNVNILDQETIDRCKIFENYVKNETTDMKVTKGFSSNLENLFEKIIEMPSEFYTKLAYALSIEEREHLKQLIENKCCGNCTNGCCRVENCEKIGLDESGKPQGHSCLGWDNPELIGRQRILIREANI